MVEGENPMRRYVLGIDETDASQIAVVGGKGAHLGELARIDGVRVPAGFCVTTEAFRPDHGGSAVDRRAARSAGAPGAATTGSRSARSARRSAGPSSASPSPSISRRRSPRALARLGERAAYAVRSSATAEDLPTASFAGQQDTYLNVVGPARSSQHVRRCWASLFTERAVTYRLRNGIDHRKVRMAVVVQRMVVPQAAGVLFTADPVTGNRKVASVEAGFGLGEALVSGRVNADSYTVRDGEVVHRAIGSKQRRRRRLAERRHAAQAIEPERQRSRP